MAARLLLALATAVTAGAAPLHDAARDGFYTDAVKMVEAGAEVDERAPVLMKHEEQVIQTKGMTPLMAAVASGHYEIAKLLLENGADHSAKNEIAGHTPCHLAAWQNHPRLFELLLDHGADPEIKDDSEYGYKPMEICHPEMKHIFEAVLQEAKDIRSGKIPRPKPEDSHGMSPMAVERKKQLAAAAAAAASGEAPAADAAPAAAEGTKEDL